MRLNFKSYIEPLFFFFKFTVDILSRSLKWYVRIKRPFIFGVKKFVKYEL